MMDGNEFHGSSTNFAVGEKRHDFEQLLCSKRIELDNFISDNTVTENDNFNLYQYTKNDLDEDEIEDIPTVYAVFCGYRATAEELSRLRSAHAL